MKLRILNLEDNPYDTELTLSELHKEWPDVILSRVDTRTDFIAAIDRRDFDLILADFSLPSFDGLSALTIAREKCPEIPFIFLTGAMGEEGAVEMLRKGATDFVLKGRLFRLASVIHRALEEAEANIKFKQTQEELYKSEARYKKLVESLTDYIFTVEVKNGQPLETMHGPGCEGITGYTTDEYRSNPSLWVDMVYKDDKDAVQKQAANILSGKVDTLEHRLIHKNGSLIWVRNVVVPRYNEQGVLVSYDGLISNITQRKESEEQIRKEMEITGHLLMIAEATTMITDIRQLLKQVISCSHEIIKCDMCLSYIFEKESGMFRPVESYGLSNELYTKFMVESIKGDEVFLQECFKKNKPVILSSPEIKSEISTSVSYLSLAKKMILIPLITRNDPLGMLFVVYNKDKEFSERESKIMQGIARQTSLALDQARLYRDSVERSIELSGRIETIQVMHEIDKSILSTLKASEILETVTHLVSRLIQCDRATVMIADRSKESFSYSAGFGLDFLNKDSVVPFTETSLMEMLETGKVDYTANLSSSKSLLPFEESLLKAGYLSHIRIPLYVKGNIEAILSIGSRRPSAFTVENLAILEKLSAQISVALQNARYLSDLEELFLGTVKSLSSAIDAKSQWTAGHSRNVTEYAVEIGKKMFLTEAELKNVELGSLLHDIGKLGINEAILDKPDRLTDEEFNLIKEHPGKGAEILSPIAQLKNVIPAIKHHHEFYDGSGYPDRLKGEEIPLLARIICVADCVDAMSSDRPYRKGMPRDAVIAELHKFTGIQFDPEIVKIFLEIFERR